MTVIDRATFAKQALTRQAQVMREQAAALKKERIENSTPKDIDHAPARR